MNHDLKNGLAWGGGLLLLALGAALARHLGALDSDSATRLVIGANGLVLAAFGNRIPKAFDPGAGAGARKARRVAGWSFTAAGLVYATLWAVAPMPLATAGGCGVIIAALAVTLGQCLSLRARARAARQ